MSVRRRGRPPLVTAAAVAVAGGALTAGCSTGAAGSAQSTGGVDNPTVSVSPTTGPPSSEAVVVRAHVAVPRSPAVRSLLTFVRAHAESVRAGRATASLSTVTTPSQLAAQRRVIDFAVTSGYVVPSEPVVQVVSVVAQTPRSIAFGTCFWLPSTEYVDKATRQPPSGPVPQSWAAAVATVRLAGVTWSVDTLKEPGRATSIRCGGHP